MRILYGITKSNFGGAQRYVYDLAREAKAQGFDVAVLAGGSGMLTKKLEDRGIEVMYLNALGRDISPLDDTRSFFHILNILYEWKPDVFHINSSKMGAMGGLAARIMQVPTIIFTSHGWAFNESRPWWQKSVIKFIHWLTILASHKTICVSENNRRDVSSWPFVKKKLVVVKNGINNFDLMTRDAARRELGVHEENTLLVGAIAELHHVKGLDLLLLAWSEFARGKRAELVIIGEGEEREKLENMAQVLVISDSVIFKGFVENARSLLRGFDILALPSRSEGFPYALLEAGIAGTPVIAANVGGVPEIIQNNTTGILIQKENPDALLAALEKLSEDKKLRNKLGLSLEKEMKTKFSMKRMLEETFRLYQ